MVESLLRICSQPLEHPTSHIPCTQEWQTQAGAQDSSFHRHDEDWTGQGGEEHESHTICSVSGSRLRQDYSTHTFHRFNPIQDHALPENKLSQGLEFSTLLFTKSMGL